MDRDEQADGVDAVADAAEGDGKPDTNPIDDTARHETDEGEDRVKGGVLPLSAKQRSKRVGNQYHDIGQMWVCFSTSTQPTEGIKHSGTHEAHEGDHSQLDSGRRIPRDAKATHFE